MARPALKQSNGQAPAHVAGASEQQEEPVVPQQSSGGGCGSQVSGVESLPCFDISFRSFLGWWPR